FSLSSPFSLPLLSFPTRRSSDLMSWLKRLILGYLSTDISFVVFMGRYGEGNDIGTRRQLWYYLGIVVTGWLSWNFFSLLGIFLGDRKSTRLNSSHVKISYAVFCL